MLCKLVFRLLIVGAFSTTFAFAQSLAPAGSKTLLVDRPASNDPIMMVKVIEGATDLKSDGHEYPNKSVWESVFTAGDDWLKDLSFTIKNVSEKTVIYVVVGCGLYETGDWKAELAKHQTIPLVGSASNVVGRRPDEALYSASLGRRLKPDSARAPFELAPGQEFTMPVESPADYEALRSRIEEKQPMSSVTACNGGISQVFFQDGTQWQGHHYLRADLERPGRWVRMSFEEWSGSH